MGNRLWLRVLIVCMAAGTVPSDSADERFMRVGEHVLAPLALVAFCLRKPARCAPSDDIRVVPWTPDNQAAVQRVQHEVNRAIEPLVLKPSNFDAPWDDDARRGVCHDFALAKRSRLMEIGYPSSALLLALAYVPTGEAHLVLIVLTDRGDYVLDNLRSDVVLWNKVPYRWVMRSAPHNVQYWQGILTYLLIGDVRQPSAVARACS